MAYDTKADGRPFFHVYRRMNVPLHTRVLDAFAEPVDRLCTGLPHRCDILIGQPEIVTFWQRRIGVGIWEHGVVVDDIRVRPAAVMKTRERDSQVPLLLDDIEDSAR